MKTNIPRMGYAEMVGFIAACMALNALSIDVMLPALPDVNAYYQLTDPNGAQAIIAIYLVGMGVSQLLYGPLSDRFGRRPVLIAGLLVFLVAGLLTTLTTSFTMMLAGRFVQGPGAGAPRVIAVSLARDNYSGPQMGKLMSLAMMIFMMVPIMAPSLGQLVLLVAPWRWDFAVLVIAAALMLVWALLRMAESLPLEKRRSIHPVSIAQGYWTALSTKATLGNMLAFGLLMGLQMGFVTSAQQIFMDAFGAGRSFTLLFALVALAMSVAAFINSRLVHKLGMRRLSMIGFTALLLINSLHLWILFQGVEHLGVFLLLQSGSMFVFGILASNLNTMAMEPMGHIAGTASSLIGFVSTSMGAGLGFLIGQSFDGTTMPLVSAYLLLGVPAFALAFWAGYQRPVATQLS